METVAAKLPKPLADEVDRLIASGMYANRSEVLRVAVRALVKSGGTGEGPRSDAPISPRVRAFYRRLRELANDERYRHRWIAIHGEEVLELGQEDPRLSRPANPGRFGGARGPGPP